MAKCLQKIGCKACGSSDSVQPFLNEDGSISGFCFGACHKFIKDPFNGVPPDVTKIKVKTSEEVKAEMQEIRECPNVPLYRQIRPEYWKRYGVRQSVNQFTGKGMYAIHHPHTRDGKLVAYMTKTTSVKRIWCLGTINEADLYGWEIAKRTGARTLYITEGQEDCLALDQILEGGDKKDYKQRYAVCSLPNGTDSVSVLGRQAPDIKRLFEDVVIVFDDDEAGRQATKAAKVFLPDAQVVVLPSKDANQVVVDGLQEEAYKLLKFRKSNAAPAGIKTFKQVKGSLYEVAQMGISIPWEEVNMRIRGLHPGLYTLAGGEGLGKTSLAHEAISHHVRNNVGVFACMMEESVEETFLNVGNKILMRDATKPETPITEAETSRLEPIFDGKLFLYDMDEDRSSTARELTENILDKAKGVLSLFDVLYIDNLTKITESILTAAERNDFISSFAAEMDVFARRTNKVVIVLSHFNKQAKGETPYAEGGRGNSNQLAGGAGLARYSLGIFYVERNTQGRDPSCIKFRIGKNRKGKITGVTKMYYMGDTTCVVEANWDDAEYKTVK